MEYPLTQGAVNWFNSMAGVCKNDKCPQTTQYVELMHSVMTTLMTCEEIAVSLTAQEGYPGKGSVLPGPNLGDENG